MFASQMQSHNPQVTAHLAQAMSYLHLSAAELEAALNRELETNPALELLDELRCPGCNRRLTSLPCPVCTAPRGNEAPVVYLSPRPASAAFSADDDEAAADEVLRARAPERLDEHILRQIGPALMAAERAIAVYLLARLDEDGLLTEAPAEAAAYLRVRLETVERVLKLIQYADPPGVGAATPQAALLIQLDCLGGAATEEQRALFELARRLISEHLDGLGKKEYALLGRRLRVSVEKVAAAAEFIRRNLTPYPARVFWGEGRNTARDLAEVLRRPDAAISVMAHVPGKPLLVEVFAPCAGWLRVDPELKAAVARTSADEHSRWAEAVERAALTVKCVRQRNHTMRRLMEIIATEQRAFILGGDADLRPLTRVRVAQMLALHESTVSRAVAGKSVLLPDGRITPLARFFDRSLSARDRVRSLVLGETQPLTDEEIADALARQGVRIARRTVAKYRKMLGILPANIRRRSGGKRVEGRPAVSLGWAAE